MGNSFLLIVAGLLLFYLVISDKFFCLQGFGACLSGKLPAGALPGAIGGAATIPGPQAGAGGGIGGGIGGGLPSLGGGLRGIFGQ
jgi:hypothetical protein